MSENPHLLSNEIHGTFGAALTGTGFSTRITGLANIFPTGDSRNDYLYKRVLREYYRNLDNHGFTGFQTDAVDAGFTPSTITGFFDPTINSLLGVTPATLLLDIFPGPLFAFSLRKINSDYSGPAVQIRRVSDNVEVNVAFDSNGEVSASSAITNVVESPDQGDTTATTLGEFLTEGGNQDAKVVTWYDQSGNGNDATQLTTASQPLIAENGNLKTDGITFDGGDEFFNISSNLTQPISVFAVYKAQPLGFVTGAGNTSLVFGHFGNGAYVMNSGSTLSGGVHPTTFVLASILFNTSSSTGHWNGVQIVSGNVGDKNNMDYVGRNASAYLEGSIKELVIYDSNQSANRTAIESNIADEYGITLS